MKLYSENENYKLYQGSMLDMLEVIEPNSIDSIITDPPYELNFMNKGWDNSGIAFQPDTWKKCYEVLKPGGYLLAFGGSRTFHRIACAIEDAGFEIRDTIMWLYGSGFPKSMDISKSLDKRNGRNYNEDFRKYINNKRLEKNISLKQINELFGLSTDGGGVASYIFSEREQNGLPTKEQYLILKEKLELDNRYDDLIFLEEAEREVVGKSNYSIPTKIYDISNGGGKRLEQNITTPSTDLAKQWQGWGTALKPSFEPIIVARKPFKGSLVDNVIEYGVGGINIDECRVETQDDLYRKPCENGSIYSQQETKYTTGTMSDSYKLGRFPANTILTYDETDFDEVCGGFPNTKSAKNGIRQSDSENVNCYGKGIGIKAGMNNGEYGDSGSASRYFYCAKASKKDRDEGLDEFETKSHEEINNRKEGSAGATRQYGGGTNPFLSVSCPRKNTHPTVKPTELMQYLVRLVTPNDGTVLDPFNGSGSTGKAVMYENKEKNKNYKYIGIELTEEYLPIAKARIEYAMGVELNKEKIQEKVKEEGQTTIFDFIGE